jgi:glycosyltransferase involved in cell wall biosynthesis
VSVVIPTRDRPDRLTRCLKSVRAALTEGDELVVVDSASLDAAAVAAAAEGAAGAAGGVDRLVRCALPGVGRARNAGWRAARHELVLFTDDDVVVDAAWADALASCLDAQPGAGFVTGRIEAPGDEIPRREVALKRERQPQVFNRLSIGNLGHSASMGTRREVLDRIGGFDEALGAGGVFRSAPEADFFDRVLAAGWSGRYDPDAVAYHEQWRSHEELVALDYGYGFGNGARLSKLVRTDRARARRVAWDALWSWGLASAWSEWRRGERPLAKAALYRVAGTGAGFARGLRTPLRDGHLQVGDR